MIASLTAATACSRSSIRSGRPPRRSCSTAWSRLFGQLLADYNASLPRASRPQQLRIRVVIHAGEVRYDAHGCFGEALDITFRLLDDSRVKKALQGTADPMVLVVSGDIYRSVVRHSYDASDQPSFQPLVCVRVAGSRHLGWIQVSGQATQHHLIDMAGYRRSA